MRDAAAIGHAVEQGDTTAVVLQHQLAKAEKGLVHVMGGIGRRYAVDEDFGHVSCFSWEKAIGRAIEPGKKRRRAGCARGGVDSRPP